MKTLIEFSHIKALKDALEEGRLAVFVGAGASQAENRNYPLWKDICNQLKEELCDIEELDFLKLAQRYEIEFGRDRLVSKLRDSFVKRGKTDLFEKILDLNPHCIITTNWDNLFNHAAEKNPSFWNVIVDDAELVGFHNEQKIIKMHGDFNHSNIVFTENDYLNYEDNFPLIETYIKSILATHVVLFMGYSFNDPDLKQILNWINKKSNYLPAKYFVNYLKDDKTDYSTTSWEKYLASWKMIVLPLKNRTLSELINDIKNFDSVSPADNPLNLLFSVCKKLECEDVILFETLRKLFSAANIQTDVLHTSKGFLLVFYVSKDKNIETIKELFDLIKLVSEDDKTDKKENNKFSDDDKEKAKIISKTFFKANLDGIALNTTTGWKNDVKIYFKNEKSKNDVFLNFKYTTPEPKENDDEKKYLRYVYNLIQVGNYYDAKKICENAIRTCSERKKIKELFISYFNKNYIISRYYLLSPHDRNNTKKELKKETIDIEQELLKYPRSVREQLGELNSFFTYKEIYQKALYMHELKEKVINSYDKKTGQQITFISNLEEYVYIWKNFISYIHSNCLYVEKNSAFAQIAKDYFYISLFLAKKQAGNKISIFEIDLYTAVKYIAPNDLLQIFSDVFEDSEKWTLELSEDLSNWFVDECFEKCIDNAFKCKYRGSEFLFDYVSNALFLLAYIQLSDDLKKQVLETLAEYIGYKNYMFTINFIESVNYFLGTRYENFGNNDIAKSDLEKLLNSFIDRIAYVKISFGELYSYTDNGLLNVFGYINATSKKYSNEKEIQKLLSSLILYDEPNRIVLLQSVVFYLYLISDEKCQNLINKYVKDKDNFSISALNKNLQNIDLQKLIICILNYHINNIRTLTDEDKNFINDYLKENLSDSEYVKLFYTQLYSTSKKRKSKKVKEILDFLKPYFKRNEKKIKNLRR